MSGIGLKTEVRNLEAIDENVAAMIAAAGDMTVLMDRIGGGLVASTQDRFERGQGPDGVAWIPSERVLRTGGQTLVDKAHLVSSLTHIPGADRVETGSNMVYAAIQHLGGPAGRGGATQLPARPYLGFDADDEAMIMEEITAYYDEVLQ